MSGPLGAVLMLAQRDLIKLIRDRDTNEPRSIVGSLRDISKRKAVAHYSFQAMSENRSSAAKLSKRLCVSTAISTFS